MKVTCHRETLLSACQVVSIAVAARTTKAVLQCIKAITTPDAMILMATDFEVGIRYELAGLKIDRAGACLLPTSRFINILRESRDDEITIDAGEETTTVELSNGRYELPASEPDEFPDVPEVGAQTDYHEIKASVIKTLIRRTVFAADKKETTKYAVSGILWEADEGKARLVATDTKRLALAEGPADIHGTLDSKGQSHLIPLKAITLLERNLHDDGELVRVALGSNEAMFQTERAVIHTRLVEGRFPPYRNIIPKQAGIKLQVPTAEFHSRVRQAAIMTDDQSKRVEFHFEAGKARITARGAETGSSEVILDLPDYAGPVLDIAFDPAYLTEMFRAIDSEASAQLEMTDSEKPAVFRLDDQYLYLVMPLAG